MQNLIEIEYKMKEPTEMEHTIYYIIQEQKEMDHRDEEANGSGANRVQGPINI
jgi:hypothetical protein